MGDCPSQPQIDAEARTAAEITYADLGGDEVLDGVMSKLRTVIDCARRLPFYEALAVADSALRSGDVAKGQLVLAASGARGNGAAQVRRVADETEARAANPFESVLRSIVLETYRRTCSGPKTESR